MDDAYPDVLHAQSELPQPVWLTGIDVICTLVECLGRSKCEGNTHCVHNVVLGDDNDSMGSCAGLRLSYLRLSCLALFLHLFFFELLAPMYS